MRIRFSLAVSLTSLLLAAGPAFADPDGFVSGQVGLGSTANGDEEIAKSGVAQIRASASQMLTPMLNVQGDIVYNFMRSDFTTSELYESDFVGDLHLYYRDSERFLVGGFIQLDQNVQSFVFEDSDFSAFGKRIHVGAEAQAYFDNFTLYGQAGYTAVTFDDQDDPYSGFFATAQIRYFLTDDFKIDLHGSVTRIAYPGDEPLTNVGVGVGAEYRLPESQVSVFGSLDHNVVNYFSDGDVTDTRVTVGLKFNFGSDTLLNRDRNGTTLDPVKVVPIYFSGAT